MFKLSQPIEIIGIELRTSNDGGRAFAEIPPLWGRFIEENIVVQILNKLSRDIYGVYNNFENEGENNQGLYTLTIGCPVAPGTEAPEGFSKVIIPASHYLQFPVEQGRQDKVIDVWQKIWAISENEKRNWSFRCEFERYSASGEIDVFIGTSN